MSSPSDTDSEVSEPARRPQPSRPTNLNGQDDGRTRSLGTIMTPYLAVDDQIWSQREPLGSGVAAQSSSSSSRVTSTGQPDFLRYNTTPFSMANMSSEARRQNLMAMDRKRRLTGSTHDNGNRRRNLSGGFNEREDVFYNRAPDSYPSSSRSPGNFPRQHFGSNASSTEVIDLTNSPPQAPVSTPSLTRRSSGSASGIYVVPQWQPDAEVTECPICKRPFTFLFRRHHCRKCGRVVCNDCSPHRITIPRQFIVNAPGPLLQPSFNGRATVDLTGDDEDDDAAEGYAAPHTSSQRYRNSQNLGIGGGEKVRLCNPCVPDPQPGPQPNYNLGTLLAPPASGRRDDLLTLSDALQSSRHDFRSTSTEPFPGFAQQQQPPSYLSQSARTRPLPLPPHSRNEAESHSSQLHAGPYPSVDVSSTSQILRMQLNQAQRLPRRGPMSFESPQVIHHRHHLSENPRMPPQPISRPRLRSMLEESYLPRMFSGHAPHPRPRLSEDDICPVCRRALPPRGPAGEESAREAHIIDCISSRDPSSQMSLSRSSAGIQSPPRGPMHMLPFVATEKDCVVEDGNVPECSICMVEYDVGDELARLECLCKFHRECISEWFTRKQECPVHKIS